MITYAPHLVHLYPYPISSGYVYMRLGLQPWYSDQCIFVDKSVIIPSLCVHVCIEQRSVMQYSAMDQTLDSINELCLCSQRSSIQCSSA